MFSFLRVVWLNAVFWVLALSVTAVFAIVGTLCVAAFSLITRDERRTMWLLRRTISRYGGVILKCGWPLVRVRYVDYAPHDTPPFVYVANHRSFSDGFLMACLPIEGVQVVNIWPFKIPLLGVVARIAGYLSIREMPFEEFLCAGRRLLSQGVSVVAFPEGTRSGSRVMGSFHGSAFRLAQQAQVPIVPLAISGNENIPRRGSMLLRPGRISMHKLPAITVEEYKDMSPFMLKTMVHDRIRQHLDAQGA